MVIDGQVNGVIILPDGTAGIRQYAADRFRDYIKRMSVKENEVRLKLFILAYTLGNIFRTLALPERIRSWSLRNSDGSYVFTVR